MQRLCLTRLRGGELHVWEEPVEGAEYVIGVDPSLGRSQTSDHSCAIICRRHDIHCLTVVGMFYARWLAARVGEVVAQLGRAYGGDDLPAMINIERNIADAPLYALRRQRYAEERFYVPQRFKAKQGGEEAQVFFQTTTHTKHILVQTLSDYLDTGRLVIPSTDIIAELRGLEKDVNTGDVRLRGKDRSVALMMAVLADSDSDPTDAEPLAPVADGCPKCQLPTCRYPRSEEPPEGVDPVNWRDMHGVGVQKRSLPGRAAWERGRAY